MGGLEHIPQAALQPELGTGPVVPAVDVDGAGCGLIEAADQIDDGALASAGFAHQSDGLSRLDVQIEVRQHRLLGFVGEAHVFKADRAGDGLPILPFGLNDAAVFRHDLGGVYNFYGRVDQADDPFRRRLGALEVRKDGRDLLDRVEKAGRIGDKGHEGAGGYGAYEGAVRVKHPLAA